MATPVAVTKVGPDPIALEDETKPWEVEVTAEGSGKPRLKNLSRAQADFKEELMWQDH
jgi:hypothetical protein